MKPARLFFTVPFLFLLALTGQVAAQTPAAENIPAGSTVTLVATADGAPTPAVEWFKDGKKIGDGVRTGTTLEYTLPLGVITATAAGTYTVKATNEVGSATSDPFVIAITTAPTKPTIRVIAVKPSQVTVEVQKGTKVITK